MLREFIASFERDIIQLAPHEFLIMAVVVSSFGLYAFYRMVRGHNIARLIENTPRSNVRSAAQGYVELSGKAKLMDGSLIVSPLSGLECVWFRYKIEEEYTYQDSKGNTVRTWRTIKSETSEDLFLLEDETGRCIIDPDDADVVTTDKRVWRKGDRRYTEELITQQEPLYAIGLFKTVGRIERHRLKHHVNDLLRQWKKSPNLLLLKYDRDNNGELNEQEWQKVVLAAERQVKREHIEQEQLNLLEMTHNKNQAFILSTLSEEKLIKRYKLHVMMYVLAFFISGSLVVWAINIRMAVN